MMHQTDWAWQPDSQTEEALRRGNQKVRNALKPKTETKEKVVMASKKTKKPAKSAKKNGHAKSERKPRDSVANFIKGKIEAGVKDVDKIVEAAKKEYPKTSPTRGYVRWIAKGMGKSKQVAPEAAAPAKSDPAA